MHHGLHRQIHAMGPDQDPEYIYADEFSGLVQVSSLNSPVFIPALDVNFTPIVEAYGRAFLLSDRELADRTDRQFYNLFPHSKDSGRQTTQLSIMRESLVEVRDWKPL